MLIFRRITPTQNIELLPAIEKRTWLIILERTQLRLLVMLWLVIGSPHIAGFVIWITQKWSSFSIQLNDSASENKPFNQFPCNIIEVMVQVKIMWQLHWYQWWWKEFQFFGDINDNNIQKIIAIYFTNNILATDMKKYMHGKENG